MLCYHQNPYLNFSKTLSCLVQHKHKIVPVPSCALLGAKVYNTSYLISLLSLMITPIVITIWLICYKKFQWFYYADPKDMVFVWFNFLVCMNYFQLLFELITFAAWLPVCLESRFWFMFLFFVFLVLIFQQ